MKERAKSEENLYTYWFFVVAYLVSWEVNAAPSS